MQPLLSICIPTYNHCDCLERMLNGLVSLPAFSRSDEIEIVVSDNCSEDRTEEVVRRFVSAHPGRVRYFRNERNVLDRNFELALSRGQGMFLKLANDNLLFTDEGLATMAGVVRDWRERRPVVFFMNDGGRVGVTECGTMDAFMTEISYFSTWIGSFGIWRDDFDALTDFARCSQLQLMQVDAVLRAFEIRGEGIVVRTKFCDPVPRPSKGGYNLAKVFGRNYLQILRMHSGDRGISRRVYRRERFRMLYSHIIPWYIDRSPENRFVRTGYFKYLWRDYWSSPLYWLFVGSMIALNGLRRVKNSLT